MQLDNMSVAKIKELVDGKKVDGPGILELLKSDSRKAVQQLAKKMERRIVEASLEEERLKKLWDYEKEAFAQGYHLVAGVDEAGRGPLAGPVVAAAVILTPGFKLLKLNDSKKLTAAQRENLYQEIIDNAVAYGIGLASVEYIERHNILNATYFAMREALSNLKSVPDYVLVDGYPVPELKFSQQGVIKGDSLSASIAAASIIAKVTRDNLMVELDEKFPQYGFALHKGYGTKEHIEKIKQHGKCPAHRASFLRNIV